MFWNSKGHAIAFRVVKTLFYFLHIHIEIVLEEVFFIIIIILNDIGA
jgi:hypothetical protein